MGITSLQVCMDSSDWSSLQGAISGDNTGLMDSPVANGDNDILTCSRPLIERRLRPNHEQALKCPRCESTHTKFCYYNNYSLTQPRYFCKTCRRYWTKGGTLRNIPVGGGCRKNKKVSSSSKKASSSSSDQNSLHRPSPSSLSSPLTLDRSNFLNRNRDQDQTADLHLAFPEQLQFSAIHGGGLFNPANTGFFFENMSSNPVEYMGSKYDHAFMGNTTTTTTNNSNDNNGMQNPSDNYLGYNNNNNPFGLMSCFENGMGNPGVGAANNLLESCQRLMLPYDNENHHYQLDQNHEVADVKPNAKILSLEWHDCNAGIKDSFGYNLGSWNGLMTGYGSSATNPPLV